jgi:outer membrane lipoprotein carrier protein|tara:strand:+ start:1764 stop:2417 length:654 start_codon:yes stop_codon:yes gene_type:complete
MAQEMLLIKNNNITKIFKLLFLIIFLFYQDVYASKNFNYFKFIKEMNSFSTSFVQNTYDENGLLVTTSNGSLIYKKKSKYILEYKSPNKIKFISDGQLITIYDQDLEQVIIRSVKKSLNNNIIDIFTNEKLINDKFELKIFFKNNENHINFLPINKDIKKSDFLLVVSNNMIKSISFVNDFDQSVIMNFNGFEINVSILESQFKIDIPESFDVIIDK